MAGPVLVTPPANPVVNLSDLKDHLRVDADDENDLIEALEQAAVAHLDGWHGILGRAVMAQVWSQSFAAGETVRLALPDAEIRSHETQANGRVVVTFDTALPAAQLPVVQMAVKLLVGHWYEHREAASDVKLHAMPKAVDALLAPLRWVSV